MFNKSVKTNLYRYKYFDKEGNEIAVLNKDYLCVLLNVDKIEIDESKNEIHTHIKAEFRK